MTTALILTSPWDPVRRFAIGSGRDDSVIWWRSVGLLVVVGSVEVVMVIVVVETGLETFRVAFIGFEIGADNAFTISEAIRNVLSILVRVDWMKPTSWLNHISRSALLIKHQVPSSRLRSCRRIEKVYNVITESWLDDKQSNFPSCKERRLGGR